VPLTPAATYLATLFERIAGALRSTS